MCNALHRNRCIMNILKPIFCYTHSPGTENPVYSYLGTNALEEGKKEAVLLLSLSFLS